MSLIAIAMTLNVLTLVGSVPVWSYSRNWGYAPCSLIGVYLLAMFSVLLLGRI